MAIAVKTGSAQLGNEALTEESVRLLLRDAQTSITRQPPLGLGPAMWKIPPAGLAEPRPSRPSSYASRESSGTR